MKLLFSAGIWILILSASLLSQGISDWADSLLNAENNAKFFPLVSEKQPGLSAAEAYVIQKAYVAKKLIQHKVAGFKAALTSESSRQKFHADQPASGVLFLSGQRMNQTIIGKSAFKQLLLEMEIGFVFDKKISETIKDVSELRESISKLLPVIELPDAAFGDMQRVKSIDLIAANTGAAQYILGEEAAVDQVDPNDISAILFRDGQEINRGKGSDALKDQWAAALWLVNQVVAQGYTIEPGHILITGVLGNFLPGRPGKYLADYGSFGEIRFEIR